MKKIILAMLTAIALTAAVATPQPVSASEVVSQHGPFVVSVLDDYETCSMGATNGTALLAFTYNGVSGKMNMSASNTGITYRTGATYTVDFYLDSEVYRWTGVGESTYSGVTFVTMGMGNPAQTYEKLILAREVKLVVPQTGDVIASVYSNADFEYALRDLVECGNILAE